MKSMKSRLSLLLLHITGTVQGLYSCTAIQDPPSNLTCGVAGHLKKPLLGIQFNGEPEITDFETCVRLMEEPLFVSGSYPGSMGYNSDTSQCYIYHPPIDQQGFKPSNKSSTKFYDIGCFSCNDGRLFSSPFPA